MRHLLAGLKRLFGPWRRSPRADDEAHRAACRVQYHHFTLLLAANRKALEIMTDMEQALRGGRVFGMSFVRSRATAALVNVYQMVKHLDGMAPGTYARLFERFEAVRSVVNDILAPVEPAPDAPLVVDLSRVDKSMADVVGTKMANIGEMKNRAGLPVTRGFVVTTAGFDAFMRQGGLRDEINRLLLATDMEATDAKVMDQRFELSAAIQQRIIQAEPPPELAAAVHDAFRRLEGRVGRVVRVSVRSSALGEDSAGASFAGQFRTVLNVDRDSLLDAYKEVVASMYGLSALSYRLNRGIPDTDAAMAVGCMVMIEARSGGVMYSRSPVRPRDEAVLINAVWGLAKAVVDGSGRADLFVVDRAHGDTGSMTVRERRIARKESRLVCHPGQGVCAEEITGGDAERPSLTDAQALELAALAVRLEDYYGGPQDIEWAIDEAGDGQGRLTILQCRPLRALDASSRPNTAELADVGAGRAEGRMADWGEPLVRGGVTVSPGVGAGRVRVVDSDASGLTFEPGSVLVVRAALPKWASLLNWASALVAEQGSLTGHLANVAREFGVPALMGVDGAVAALSRAGSHAAGQGLVTVDADGLAVYAGVVADLVERDGPVAPRPMEGTGVHDILRRVAAHVTPLNLLDPDGPDFRARNCRTLHDITRYCHERSVQEMFNVTLDDPGGRCGKRLWAGVATQFWVVDLDDGFSGPPEGKFIRLENIASTPMLALWEGISAVPWEGPPSVDARGFMSIVMQATTNPALNVAAPSSYTNRNYFLVSRDFCNLQSRFGFHFSTVEALVGERPHANYVTFRFKGGAADLNRRRRRAGFIRDILERAGFSVRLEEDSLTARVEGGDREHMAVRLRVLGYLTMHTRQLDMIMKDPAEAAAQKRRLLEDIGSRVAPELALLPAAADSGGGEPDRNGSGRPPGTRDG